MKRTSNLADLTNQTDAFEGRRLKAHRWVPSLLVFGWLLWGVIWPMMKDIRVIAFLPLALPLGFMQWLDSFGVPDGLQYPISVLLLILMLSLPWFSLLASSARATTVCSIGVCLLLAAQISGCQSLHKKYADLDLLRHTSPNGARQQSPGQIRAANAALGHNTAQPSLTAKP